MADITTKLPEPKTKATGDSRSIEEKIREICADVPEEEWKKFPADFGSQMDYYLYGTPKRP